MTRARALAPVALGTLAFVIYAWAAAPGPYWLDSQELGAAGVRLGSPHPTGFPLFNLLARLCGYLPFGELAWRVHLVSALSAAVAVGFVVAILLRLAGDDVTGLVVAVAGGLLLGASGGFFRMATVTEVYAPTAALLALALWLLLGAAAGSARAGLALCLVAGVGIAGLHAELRLLLVAPIAALLLLALRAGRRWPLVGPGLTALGALGTLVYLPLRSASGAVAVLDWGHPRTLGALWDHAVVAARIRAAYGEEMLAPAGPALARHADLLAGQLADDLGPVALAAAAAGLAVGLLRARPRLAVLAVAVVAAVDVGYALWLNPMGLGDRQNGVPFALAVALLAALGLGYAARRFGRAAPFAAAAFAVMVVVPAGLAGGAERAAIARSDAPRAFAELALGAVPPRGLALVQNDSTAAGLVWLAHVEGARPDAGVLVRQHAWDVATTRAVLARAGAAGDRALATGRPIAWELGVDALPRGTMLGAGAPLARLVPEGSRPPGKGIDRAVRRLDAVFAGAAARDANARRTHGGALVALGRGALAAGAPDAADTLFARAHAADPAAPAPLVNLGVVAAARGDHTRAAELTEQALARDPVHLTALLNAARYRLAANDDAAALRFAERAAAVAPRSADAWALLGTLAARQNDVPSARTYFQRALAIDPEQPEAKINLGKLRPTR